MNTKKQYAEVANTDSRRSWFCVLHRPEEVFGEGLTPEEVVHQAVNRWRTEHPNGACGVNYEISDSGSPHLHMVLEEPAKARFSNIKKLYGETIHIEPTKGNKKQAMAYLNKEPPFGEKAHTIVVPPLYFGTIQADRSHPRSQILEEIETHIQAGLTPRQIMALSLRYRKEETLIRKAYFAKREAETPPKWEVAVYWHVGASGTGKSYTYVQLCEERGEEMVYMMSDFQNGGLDLYNGEPILFMDELRGMMPYGTLLGMLEGLKKQIHCRYANAVGLWTEVHITSVYPPEGCYELMVPYEQRGRDTLEQLMRRITEVVYHYVEDGAFRTYRMPGNQYQNYTDLRGRVNGKDGFLSATVDEVGPFEPEEKEENQKKKEEPKNEEERQERMSELPGAG